MKLLFLLSIILSLTNASIINEYLNSLNVKVLKENPKFKGFDKKRGEKIFTSKHIGKRGKEISCTSCHGVDLTKSHKNFFTGKVIKPLSQKVNPKRLTKLKDIKKWLKRNFKDVYNRVGTPKEKGDVITYILTK